MTNADSFARYTNNALVRQRNILINSLRSATPEDQAYMRTDIDAIEAEQSRRANGQACRYCGCGVRVGKCVACLAGQEMFFQPNA